MILYCLRCASVMYLQIYGFDRDYLTISGVPREGPRLSICDPSCENPENTILRVLLFNE